MDILKSYQKKTAAMQNFRWPLESALFPPLSPPQTSILQDFPKILDRVWPLNKARRKSLPYDIRDLSRVLTSRRSDLKKPYWMKPAWISAYLHYFLPWNLIRLVRLFNGLKLPEPDFATRPLLIDAGSGPLSVPLALWIAKSEWRKKSLKVLAVDVARHPLELGLKIFNALCETRETIPWSISLSVDPIWKLRSALRKRSERLDASPWLIVAANVLNESNQFDRDSNNDIDNEDEEDSFLFKTLMSWNSFREYPSFRGVLAIEPGTRFGGSTIMELRKLAIDMGYSPVSPCVGSGLCPLYHKKKGKSGGLSEKWCHFTFAVADVPRWLARLSEESGLAKKTLSLSLALLSTNGFAMENPYACRVISHIFPVPGLSETCRYGCASGGLRLLPHSRDLPSGALTHGKVPVKPYRDKRSDAVGLEPLGKRLESKGPAKTKFRADENR